MTPLLVVWLAAAQTETSSLTYTATAAKANAVAAMDVVVPVPEPPPEPLWGVKIHGFVSQGYLRSTDNNFLGTSKKGTFEFTEVGINFTKSLTDRLSTGIQFFARRFDSAGDFSAKFDWFYLDYRFADWFGVRAGRVKLPFGLYNELSDIDSARVAVLLPQSVYPSQNRDFLLAQTGGEIYGYVPVGGLGAFEYRAYGGTIVFNEPSATNQFQGINVSTPYLVGGRILWETPLEGLRLAASAQRLRIDLSFTIPTMPQLGTVSGKLPASFLVVSGEYAHDALLISAEYSRWWVEIESNFFPQGQTINDRGYVMATYQSTSWFSPGAYYAIYFPNDFHHTDGRAGSQHDIALTLRFDINEYWLLKLEGHYLHGTAYLNVAENNNTPLSALEGDWALFLVKTTLHF